MTLTDEEALYILTKEFDENDDVDEHFIWYLDEKNSIQCECRFHAINFFDRSIGNAFKEEDFTIDIKMSLLSCAIDKLQVFFTKKSNQAKFPKIFSELFYTDKRVIEIICEEGFRLGYWKHNEAPRKIYEINNLNLQIPKIKLQWFIFVIFFTKDYQGRDLTKLAQRFLKLKKTKNKFAIEFDVINEAQNRIRNFANILKKYELAKYEGYNLSLNLYYFNKVTSLFELVQIFNGYKEKAFVNNDLSKACEIEGLAVINSFIRKGNYGEILTDKSTLQKYNWIFNVCKNLLTDIFADIATEENYGLPDEVATAYITFKYLHADTTYSDILLQDFMLLKDMELQLGSQGFENFGLLYKELYIKNAKKD